MTRTLKTINEVKIKKGAYASMQYEITIPSGSPVDFKNGEYFVSPSIFEANSIDKHDATYYGFRINKDNVQTI